MMTFAIIRTVVALFLVVLTADEIGPSGSSTTEQEESRWTDVASERSATTAVFIRPFSHDFPSQKTAVPIWLDDTRMIQVTIDPDRSSQSRQRRKSEPVLNSQPAMRTASVTDYVRAMLRRKRGVTLRGSLLDPVHHSPLALAA
tara:strand:+ start:142425 stop:142856 length:432 start_codon:yes stop_codon:yes gene_type:complete